MYAVSCVVNILTGEYNARLSLCCNSCVLVLLLVLRALAAACSDFALVSIYLSQEL